ncbi:Uncharacterised protein [Slackia heliotrinireducens]|uniref:DUF5050 domain-containing protein n=1 Tax=Slackia heliotrinireducens (strain ATCC 29202 / DSM 20476 / NCTC 11029 / RHS 1) TaxID=471855 RepID=C7N5H4_SLAHD|nr:hypothetical protein [Slackia heliotrinireducens]ACV22159.1 hypothetical protein Shel_11240 [Slackia heliotrinireducens DSM 20476]VEH00220.1 Uncharacterised protein [Slackia heliotrinireducens]
MKKIVRTRVASAALAALAALMLMAAVGCSSGGEAPADVDESADATAEAPAEATAEQAFGGAEPLPVAADGQIVSDDERICFYYDHELYGYSGGESGVYCTDPDMTAATLVFEDMGCYPLCLDGDALYCRGSRGLVRVDLSSHAIEAVDGMDGRVRAVAPFASDGEGSGTFVNVAGEDVMQISQVDDAGAWTSETVEGVDEEVLYAVPADGVVYFVQSDEGYGLCSYDPQDGSFVRIASIYAEKSFDVVGPDVYYVVDRTPDDSDDPDARVLELMCSDAEGNESPTGVKGDISHVVDAYGQYVLYTEWREEANADGEPVYYGEAWCYDTETGATFRIDRPEFDGMDITVQGAASGYLYFVGTTYDEITGDAEVRAYFCRLDGSGEVISAEDLTAAAEETDEATAWREAEDQAMEEASEKAYQESLENEPYGPGTSKLYLEADDEKSACYRLVRMDGTVEFQVLLAPGEETVQEFPCGRYTLKIAEGETWISDEEAFGPDGEYDTTNLFTFEAGEAYGLGTGTQGNVYNDDQSGFLG